MKSSVEDAQIRNAAAMSDSELRRELALALERKEQPPIRRRWIEILLAEQARRP